MNISMLFMVAFLLLSGLSLSFAKEASKNNSKPIPSKIQYSAEQGYQPDNNSIYGSSDSLNPYGGLPGIYGGFGGPQEILRNRFSGSGSNSQDENQDGGYQNEQSTGGSGFQYPGSGEGNEVPNGVFSNPFLGQRRITSGIPSYGGTTNSGSEPGYGGSERGYGGSEPSYGGSEPSYGGSERGYGGSEPGYGGGSYPGGRYSPSYGGFQPGIYSSSPSGFRPGSGQGFIYPTDQGYWYPMGGGGNGVGFRQPNYPSGYGSGNGYGVYPGILRNIPAGILPSGGGSGIYRQIPRGYGPSLFGYGQYPQMAYPGLGFDYGRLNESNPSGDGSYRNITPQGSGLPYPQSTPASVSPGESSQAKIKSLRKEDP